MTLNEVRASYTGEKLESGIKDPWAHHVARPISFYIAWLLIRCRVTANSVTLVGLALGMAGCASLASGGYWAMIAGAVLVNIYGLLDYVDGDIARATKTESKYGARIDGLSYLVVTGLLFIAVGIGLRDPLYLWLGLAASYVRIFRYAVSYQSGLPSEGPQPNVLVRLGIIAITLREPLLLVCAITGTLHWFLVFYAVVHLGELGVILVRVFKG